MWGKKDSYNKKISDLALRLAQLEETNKVLASTVMILNKRLDKHMQFIDSLSRTNTTLLKILDLQNSPVGKTSDEVKFLGFDYEDEAEEK